MRKVQFVESGEISFNCTFMELKLQIHIFVCCYKVF